MQKTGFLNTSLKIQTIDGLDDELLEPLYFTAFDGTCYRAPIGSTTDGMSTPKIVRILPGYDATGDDWFSGVLHDSAYRNFLEVMEHGMWEPAFLTQEESDMLILEAMVCQKVGIVRRSIIYFALRMFGVWDFNEDRERSPC